MEPSLPRAARAYRRARPGAKARPPPPPVGRPTATPRPTPPHPRPPRPRAAPGRFKYVSYRAFAGPERLVVDLWKSATPTLAATIRSDGCLRLVSSRVAAGRVTVSGLELRPLFEHNVVVRLRDASGRQVLVRPLTAANGRWAGSFRYRVAAGGAGTLEAVSQSA